MHKFTDEQIEFIRKIAKGKNSKVITELFNNKFNLNLKVSQIQSCKHNHNIKSGIDCRFKKRNIPVNKGKKGSMSPEQYKRCKATMFKKGNIPQNHKPVGSERIDKDGYTYIKVAEPNRWKLKHRILWEKNNGPIPEKHKLIFADGNRQNICLDNLILVSYAEAFIMNQKRLFKKDKDLTKSGVAVAKILDKVNKRKKDL